MKYRRLFIAAALLASVACWTVCAKKQGATSMTFIGRETIDKTVADLAALHGQDRESRIRTGVQQAAAFWRSGDGTSEEFTAFCAEHFISDPALLEKTLGRFEGNFEALYGHLAETSRELNVPMDLDIGPMLPVDYLFAEYAPFAHVNEDLFKTKLAFVVLLNFAQTTLEDKIRMAAGWSRLEWAEARLADTFDARVPAEVGQALNAAYVSANDYIANYNIWMHHLIDSSGRRPFPEGLKLISHWGLRDEIKARYADPDGLGHQRMIRAVMERIIRQEIPKAVIDNPSVDWDPVTNAVAASPVREKNAPESAKAAAETGSAESENNDRYAKWLAIAAAERMADPYYPSAPTLPDRRFRLDREIPEVEVERILTSVCASEEYRRAGRLVEKRLGRPLEPFDIWYNGFKPRPSVPAAELDRIVASRYPDIAAFKADIPRLLAKLDFSAADADFIASRIGVDPARGAGHAMEPGRRGDSARLRTRVPSGGMDYKGYNIACHELGHNVEQVLSLNRVDHTLLRGVPNTAFTEAFAFVFQARDLEWLGLGKPDPAADHLEALDVLWQTAEISGVALIDMKVWRWIIDHPSASPAELKSAVLDTATAVWNTWFAPVFGVRDVILLGVYSHMIDAGLYLPDYPMGHVIAFQVERYLKGKKTGPEMERMCRLGSITPGAWMKAAVGTPISTEPLLKAAAAGLDAFGG
jgi:hypothetical protein